MEAKKLKIYGSIFGAFVGDAIGCNLEFGTKIIYRQIEHCLTMPGGGPFKKAPGQVSDDSEFAISLMYGLLEGKGSFNINLLRKHYLNWFQTKPIDMGFTTKKAMNILNNSNLTNEECLKKIYGANLHSQANGGLMKMTPLGCFFHNLDRNIYIKNIVDITKLDQSLTHPNKTSIEASIIYNIAIYNILNGYTIEETFQEIRNYIKSVDCNEIKEWWELIENDQIYNSKRIGHVKIAFTNSFYLWKHKYFLYDGFKKILKLGGDTDTNLAIAGGLLGAYHGFNNIDKNWIDKLLNCESDRDDIIVPKKINLYGLIDRLTEISPKENIKIII